MDQIVEISGLCYSSNPCWHDVTYAGGYGKRVCGIDIVAALLLESNWKYLAGGPVDIVETLKHLGQYVYTDRDRGRFHDLVTSVFGTKSGCR